MRTRHVKRAFTLIEILIVVVILGILAAIVIPQFTDASDQAMDANVRTQLQTLRSQIELHNVQNPLTQYDTTTVGSGIDATFWDPLVNGDYIQRNPRNPYLNMPEAAWVGAAAGAFGWCGTRRTRTCWRPTASVPCSPSKPDSVIP